jgi:hypothetical protein
MPLKVLAEAVEPLKNYERHGQAAYTSLSPFTRFVDACAPESLAARDFGKKVDQFLAGKDPKLGREIGADLKLWKVNHALVLPLIAASPALREIEPLSLGLARACEAGLEALDGIMKGQSQPATWAEEKVKILVDAAKPAAHAELAVLTAVTKLVQACAGPVK